MILEPGLAMNISPENLVGSGVFTWDGAERRSNRYGAFTLTTAPYGGGAVAIVVWNHECLAKLRGRRVQVVCVVREVRVSGHIGDLFLGIFPSRPDVGEEVRLGVGRLEVLPCDWEPDTRILEIHPSVPRDELWLDPHVLYRLHDQTVDVYAAETDVSDQAFRGTTPARRRTPRRRRVPDERVDPKKGKGKKT